MGGRVSQSVIHAPSSDDERTYQKVVLEQEEVDLFEEAALLEVFIGRSLEQLDERRQGARDRYTQILLIQASA